jgi:hypothetical protein
MVRKLVGMDCMVLDMVLHMASHSMALVGMGMVRKDHSNHCGRRSSLLRQTPLPLRLLLMKGISLLFS